MSGSEFERETIVTGMLSATADSKAADAAHDASYGPHTPELHTWRPQAEGLYDLSLEKDSAASASSPTSRARSRIRSSPTR